MVYEILEGKFSIRKETSDKKEVGGILTISSDGKVSFEPSQSNTNVPAYVYSELITDFFNRFRFSYGHEDFG